MMFIATSQPKSYGCQKLANFHLIILFNIKNLAIILRIQTFNHRTYLLKKIPMYPWYHGQIPSINVHLIGKHQPPPPAPMGIPLHSLNHMSFVYCVQKNVRHATNSSTKPTKILFLQVQQQQNHLFMQQIINCLALEPPPVLMASRLPPLLSPIHKCH